MKQKKGLIIVIVLAIIAVAAVVVLVGIYGFAPANSDIQSVTVKNSDGAGSSEEDSKMDEQREIDETKATDRVNIKDAVSVVLKQDGTKASGNGVQVQGNKVTITKAGSYELSGSLTEGQIYVDAGGKDIVVFLLNNVELANSVSEALHVENAGETILILPEGTKSVIRSGKKQEIALTENVDDPEMTGGAVYSRDDLTISGAGELTVGGYLNNGIHSTNHLRIDSGTVNVEAVHHGIKGKDWVTITGGVLNLTAGKDGITSSNDTDAGYGMVDIAGGEMHITVGDDGIHAERELYIKKGIINVIKSYEGLEANQITIVDGQISIVSSDDGMNAYGGQNAMGFRGDENTKTTEETPNLIIYGGEIVIDAEGDGLDSNGNLVIEGGNILVNGPEGNGNGALDVGAENGGQCLVNGGTILALGSSGMAESFDEDSGQCSFLYNGASFGKGTKIVISGSDGKKLFAYTAVKSGQSVVFSSPELTKGDSCTITVGDTSEEISLDGMANGDSGFSGRGGPGGGMKPGRGIWPGGGKPDGERPEGGGMHRGGGMRPDGSAVPE